MKLLKKTPLKFLFQTKKTIGVGRNSGCEVIPNTEASCKRWNLEYKPYIPKEINIPKDAIPYFNRLRPYQKEDAIKLAQGKVTACFNQQRTGKTPTSLVTFMIKEVKHFIIVCPTSIMYAWKEEVETWTNKTVIVLEGTRKQRLKLHEQERDVTIIGYDLLRGFNLKLSDEEKADLIKQNKPLPSGTLDLDLLEKWSFDGLIVDEAHRIKNRKSLQYKAVNRLRRKTTHFLPLTGTPAPNKQYDLFGILSTMYKKIFTSYWRFIEYFFDMYTEQIYTGRGARQTYVEGELKHKEELQQFLDLVSTNRTRADVMTWLPDKDYTQIKFDLTRDQKRYLKSLQEFFYADDVFAENVLVSMMRERQICLAPELIGLKGKSPKALWLKQYIKDYPEKRILIFSNFTTWLKYLSKELKCDNLFIGDTTPTQANQLKKDFQSGKINLMLLNIAAAKEGVTLGNATTVIFTDVYPPAGYIEQAEDRGIATSEDGPNLGLEVIQLMMKDSYDEDLYEIVKENLSETEVVNRYKKYIRR